MNDFPFDHDSGKAMNRHMSNAKAETGLEKRKLRDEIERLREKTLNCVSNFKNARTPMPCAINARL